MLGAYLFGVFIGLLMAAAAGMLLLLAVARRFGVDPAALLRARRDPARSLPPVDIGRTLAGGSLPPDLSAYRTDAPPAPDSAS